MYRHARSDDVSQIAALHADNWRRFYRGAYLDSYLDGDVAADRLAVWGDRLSGRPDDCFTLVADDEGLVVGFVRTIFDADPDLGAYLENLHVRQDRHGRGIGKGLVIAAAAKLLQVRPGSGLFLWVLEQNRAAQGFYAALGGMCTRRELRGPFPGGGRAPGLRYAWPHPEQLLAAGPPQYER